MQLFTTTTLAVMLVAFTMAANEQSLKSPSNNKELKDCKKQDNLAGRADRDAYKRGRFLCYTVYYLYEGSRKRRPILLRNNGARLEGYRQ